MRQHHKSVEEYVAAIRAGNRVVLGQAITLVESTKTEHQALAQSIIARLLENPTTIQPYNHTTIRIGITGSPGVGKSTFIEALGMHLTEQGKKVAVLAIDPSSQVSRGSILGDKTRMERLSATELAFIRPSPAGTALGGVARKTRETILLVEAAGYDTVIIETVGVGQSEVAVHGMSDFFLLLLLPGAGDELQGIKRGIVEMADLLVVNKAEGERKKLADQAQAHYRNALHLFPQKTNGWSPKVLTCSALENQGIGDVLEAIEQFRQTMSVNGFFQANRARQAQHWLQTALLEGLQAAFWNDIQVKKMLADMEPAILSGHLSPFAVAKEVLEVFLVERGKER